MDKSREPNKKGSNKKIIIIAAMTAAVLGAASAILLPKIFKSDSETNSEEPTAAVNGKTYDENNIGEVYCAPIDEAHIVTEDDGTMYIDNEVLVVAANGVTKDKIEELAKEYDAEIVGCIEQTGDYQLRLSKAGSLAELQETVKQLSENELIESAVENTVFNISEYDYPFPSPPTSLNRRAAHCCVQQALKHTFPVVPAVETEAEFVKVQL